MTDKTTKLKILTTVPALLVIPRSTVGCSCVSMPTAHCDIAWANGEIIFVGTVASKLGGERPLGDGIVQLTDYDVHFSSIDILRGTTKSDEPITLHTGDGGGDCGYPFVIGRQYLVYASNFKDRLTTGICSQTAPVELVSETIHELRKLRDKGRSDELFGNIGVAPIGASFEALLTVRPLSNVAVHAEGKKGLRFSSVTDDRGGYAFASIPLSEYSIQEELPPGLRREDKQVVDLRYARNHLGCRVSSFPKPDGRIAGRITDAGDAGVAGFITVEPSDPEEASQARERGGLPGDETNDGRFSLDWLPPGTYRLIFHPKHGNRIDFQQTIVWPPRGLSGLSLGLGQHVDDVKFQVP